MRTFVWSGILVLSVTLWLTSAQHNPHQWENRSVIVHLFEWKWKDVADECERFLAPNGFAGVQVSPANENVIIGIRPWWERYQPISYKLITRSGNEADFAEMCRRCNAVGIRIYVDVVINHMMASQSGESRGTGGSGADPGRLQFPAVPFGPGDFHPTCSIDDYNNANQVRNCNLVGLHDLNQGVVWVREKIVGYLNRLIELGAAGYRVDAAKHMWPADLQAIYSAVRDLNTDFGFPAKARPFVYQEVIDLGGEGISKNDYTHLGLVTEFRASAEMGKLFRGNNALKWLRSWGPEWSLLPSKDSLVFVDNHDNQRGHGGGGAEVLTYKQARQYKMATAFLLSHPYGHTRLMSSYAFTTSDEGPPQDSGHRIVGPSINSDGTCGNGWICEHRWRQIYNMVGFRNAVHGTDVTDFTEVGNNQIAFCRSGAGFIAFNNEPRANFTANLQTRLPAGTYCDVISGSASKTECTGRSVSVRADGKADIYMGTTDEDGVLAIHIGERSRLHFDSKL